MLISKDQTISSIQLKFRNLFPFLKLEIYSCIHENREASSASEKYNENTLLSTINPQLVDAEIDIEPEMTVSDFEKMMELRFGLNTQVFRNSAGLWLQTTATDYWTLGKQNGKGERSETSDEIEPINVTDFDLE